MQIDFLIIGQGLAGSLLAWELIQRGYQVLIVDNGIENASQCAAGLINPITGMRFVKSAQIETLLPVAKDYYRQLGVFFQQNFYVEKTMLRIFHSEKEACHAQKRVHDLSYQAYWGEIITTPDITAPFGMIEQLQTAYVLTSPLLSALKQFFIEKHCYQKSHVDYKDLKLTPNLSWHDIQPKQLIFCEGYQLHHNPWFSKLPLQAAKGEILTLEITSPLPNKILNYGHWLIPLERPIFRTGATFDTQNIDTLCTEKAKNLLLKTLQEVLPQITTAKILKHQANIRPCTLDKQPFIGCHPHYSQLGIFNGFGAKGSLQIPYYSRHFANYLERHHSLDKKVDIARYQL